jgi:hypothetical protein
MRSGAQLGPEKLYRFQRGLDEKKQACAGDHYRCGHVMGRSEKSGVYQSYAEEGQYG